MNNQIDISLPDRYDMLKRKAHDHLNEIITPVEESLLHIDFLHADMRASSRGQFLILRGDSGTGKSTFIHTVGLFRDGIETITLNKDIDLGPYFSTLSQTTSDLRIIVLEGREALTDVSNELLEKSIHAINAFVRTENGERSIIAWPVNRDDLADKLAALAKQLGAESLTGLGDPIYRFAGPPKLKYREIADNTISLLNQGEKLHDLGISDIRAEELLTQSTTIGNYLALVRKDLLNNQQTLAGLVKKDRCRMWVIVLAGNDAEGDVDAVTRGTMYSSDIDRMMAVTNANIVAELKSYPEKIGMLGTYFDARVLHVPVLAVLAAIRAYASDALRTTMKTSGMTVTPDDDVIARMLDTNIVNSFKNQPIRARKVGSKTGPNSVLAFQKLSTIASTNDVALNRAFAECLKAVGVISSYEVEQDFGIGLTRRTDIVVQTADGPVRLEMMWRKKTGRAEIANYVLQKLFNYGKAVGYLS